MEICIFAHSWLSDWNHGNAHFLRGLASALVRRGHRVRAYEGLDQPWGGWSLAHLWAEPGGAAAVRQMRHSYPDLDVRLYACAGAAASSADYPVVAATGCGWVCDWSTELRGAEVVLVHEWNPPGLFDELLRQRARHGFRLLLHDTHHRALSQPESLTRLPLAALDGVIAFGESLRRVYAGWGVKRAYTLHEAADIEHFRPLTHAAAVKADGPHLQRQQRPEPGDCDLVWIGNWGDEERTRELQQFLLTPARALRTARARVYGVRYPRAAQTCLAAAGIAYGGYLANLQAPAVYAQSRVTVHIPRHPYGGGALPGIPTIRVFEALACGIALVCAPWQDSEGLFRPGEDYWVAASAEEMTDSLKQLLSNAGQRTQLGRQGAATVAARHTCAHRARELEEICRDLA